TGPHCGDKITAVFPLAEIPVLDAFLIDIIPVLDFDSGVNDRDEADMAVLHLTDKFRETGKLLTKCKILIRIHVIDIHIDHVQGDVVFAVSPRYLSEIFFRPVSPAALTEAKSKLRRDIAPADDVPELFYDIVRRAAGYHVQIQICISAGHSQGIHSRVPDVKSQAGRIVKQQAERLFSPDYEEIVGAVKRALILGMVWVVRTVADVAVTALVDAPGGLAETVDDSIAIHRISKRKSVLRADRSVRQSLAFGRDLRRNSVGPE